MPFYREGTTLANRGFCASVKGEIRVAHLQDVLAAMGPVHVLLIVRSVMLCGGAVSSKMQQGGGDCLHTLDVGSVLGVR